VLRGRFLLLLVALFYGSLNVSLRMVYARPGPPEASILSATRGWMTVLCLLPVTVLRPLFRFVSASHVLLVSSSSASEPLLPRSGTSAATTTTTTASAEQARYSKSSFYWYALELAVFNFGTQGLLNIGLLTTESARSAFFTQLSVVITPVLAATVGAIRRQRVVISRRVWMSCFLALLGLYVLSSSSDDNDNDGSASANSNKALNMSFGDLCCLASAVCWSYYIYRLSDWGDRYDEAETMLVKNVFMAILYTLWTVASYYYTTTRGTADSDDDGFYMWRGWKDPVSLSILFYTALSSGAISDILQQKGQADVSAAESNVILTLEPVFSAILGLLLLAEVPSARECLGGAFIVLASFLSNA